MILKEKNPQKEKSGRKREMRKSWKGRENFLLYVKSGAKAINSMEGRRDEARKSDAECCWLGFSVVVMAGK